MLTRVTRVLTKAQLESVLSSGYDISLVGMTIYDLRARTSYRLMTDSDQLLTVEPTYLDEAQVLITDVDGDIQAQVTSDAVRLLLDRLGAVDEAAKVELTVDTALRPDFETSSLDRELTAGTLREEFKKRDLQDLATLRTGELPADSVGTDALQDGAVRASKIASGAVQSRHITPDAVQAVHIKDGAVTGAKLAEGAVKSSVLEDGAVTGAKLQDNSVTLDKLAPDARSATGVSQVLPSGSVTGDKLADGAIGRNQLANGAVTYEKIADGAVRSDKLAVGSVDGSKVAPRTLSLDHFAEGAAGLVADNSVGQEALQDGAVSADKLQSGLLSEPVISGSDELAGLDVTLEGTGFSAGQPVGVFANAQGNLQAVVLTTAALTAVLGALPSGTTAADLMYGIVRQQRSDGLVSVATVPGAQVSGYSNLVQGGFYKPETNGAGFERTTVAAEAKAVALDANTLRIGYKIST